MNVALVIFRADPARGGAERYTLNLAEALARRGHQISLLASTFDKTAQTDSSPQSVEPIRLHADGTTRRRRYLRFLDALDTHLDRHRYDIIHAMLPVRRCNLYHPHAGLAGQTVRAGHLKHDSPLARTSARLANQLNRKRRAFAAVERALLEGPRPPLVLCLSEEIKRTVRQHYILGENRLATLFNAVNLTQFDPDAPCDAADVRGRFGIAAELPIALMIAQDFQRKGLRQAMEAISRLKKTNSPAGAPTPLLLVVGRPEIRPWMRLAEQMGVADRVRFAGPTDDPASFYRAADFFVLPTRHDPCSLVVLEALAMGLPVISTRINGACEIMADGVHGRILENPADIDALAAAMQRLLDPAERQRMAAACLQLRPQLAWAHHLDTLERLYSAQAGFPDPHP